MNNKPVPYSARRLIVCGVALLSVVSLSSCASLSDPNHEKESTYAKASEMDEGNFELQNWIPWNATDVRIKISTTAEARPIAMFTLPDGQLPERCADVTVEPPAPRLNADWMPGDAASEATKMCGDFAVIAEDSTMFAWDTRTPEAS